MPENPGCQRATKVVVSGPHSRAIAGVACLSMYQRARLLRHPVRLSEERLIGLRTPAHRRPAQVILYVNAIPVQLRGILSASDLT